MADTLIVYYSRSGHSKQVAEELAQRIQADIEEIKPLKPISFAKGGFQAVAKRTPAIQPPRLHAQSYAHVVLITPIWAGTMASPVRTYMEGNARSLRDVRLITLSGSSTSDKVIEELRQRYGLTVNGALEITQQKLASGSYRADL